MPITNSVYFNLIDDIEDVTHVNDELIQAIQNTIEIKQFDITNYVKLNYFNQLSNVEKRKVRNHYLQQNLHDYFDSHRLIRFQVTSPLFNSLLDWYGRDLGLPQNDIKNNCFKFIDNFQVFDGYVYASIKVMFNHQTLKAQLKQQTTYIQTSLLGLHDKQSWDYFINEFVFGKKTLIEASVQYHTIIKQRIQNALKYNQFQFNFKNLENHSV